MALTVGNELDDEAAGAGHIVRLVVHDGDHTHRVEALVFGLSLGEAGTADVETGQLAHSGAQRAAIGASLAGDILSNHAAFDVGRGAHGRPCSLAGDGVAHHGAVAHGVDVGIVGLSQLVGEQGALEHLQTSVLQEGGVGTDTGAEHHQVTLIAALVGEHFLDLAVFTFQAGDLDAGGDGDPGVSQLALDVGGKFWVKAGEHMGRHIQHEGLYTPSTEVLGDFQADVAGAHHHGLLDGAAVHQGSQIIGVLGRAHEKDVSEIHAVDGGLDGAGAGGDDELVIGIDRLCAGGKIPR